MSNLFITNQDKLLSEVFNNILPSTDNLYFLVGYFYFSGFEEIYENVTDKKIKILVGLDIEKDITNKIKEVEYLNESSHSRGQIRVNYYKAFTEVFNETDFYDNPKQEKAFRIFISKINDGSLEIRKTQHPNHAKLYIFENKKDYSQGGEFPGTIITGSSNLTRAGLKHQHEINILSRDKSFYDEAVRVFDELWKDAIEIINQNSFDDFLHNVIEKIWIDKLPKPFLLYIRVLHEYFSLPQKNSIKLPSDITDKKFLDLKYQTDAIAKAISTLEQHNGVIIADVVGLGKSIIASAIAFNLRLKTIIIAPPHLQQQWEDYRWDFFFTAEIYSSGKIEEALEKHSDEEERLIIIDEAHKYRNEDTIDYANLHKLCQKNKVILLSATPFNNRPQDIFSLIRLFQITTKSTIQTVDNLSYQFRDLIKEFKKIKEGQKAGEKSDYQVKQEIEKLADKIRDILSPLIIRRSRIDLEEIEDYKADLKAQKISFPKVNDPEMLEYDLGELSELYENTLLKLAPNGDEKGFIGARYMPVAYVKNIEKYLEKISDEFDDVNLFKQGQINLAGFMKHLLVRRFESSLAAFQSSLDSLIYSSELILDWYHRLGKVPIYKKGGLPSVDELLDETSEDVEKNTSKINYEEELSSYFEKGLVILEKKELKLDFIRDLEKDIELLKGIKQDWFGKKFPYDPKIEGFKKILRKKLKENSKRKIVVFTEFNDTANYLYEEIKDEFRAFKYSSAESSYQNKRIIRENFDAGIKQSDQKNDYDILVATDAISEGFNLHRAGIIFNYDIPFNPTRVIQRVGRINRINKKVFDELFIFNFFPSKTGERETRVKQISTLKLTMIHALIGEDTKVLTNEEELRSYFVDRFRDEMKEQEAKLSWDAKYLNDLSKLRKSKPELIKAALDLPKRVRIRRENICDKKGVLIFGKKGTDYIFKFADSLSENITLSAREAIELFKTDLSEDALPVSNNFEKIYQFVKNNLFLKRSEVALDKGKREAIDKVEYFIQANVGFTDYFKDLRVVLKELDSLPEHYMKLIRKIKANEINKLIEQVPHDYLSDIINKSKRIDDAEEHLILSEELS